MPLIDIGQSRGGMCFRFKSGRGKSTQLGKST